MTGADSVHSISLKVAGLLHKNAARLSTKQAAWGWWGGEMVAATLFFESDTVVSQ